MRDDTNGQIPLYMGRGRCLAPGMLLGGYDRDVIEAVDEDRLRSFSMVLDDEDGGDDGDRYDRAYRNIWDCFDSQFAYSNTMGTVGTPTPWTMPSTMQATTGTHCHTGIAAARTAMTSTAITTGAAMAILNRADMTDGQTGGGG